MIRASSKKGKRGSNHRVIGRRPTELYALQPQLVPTGAECQEKIFESVLGAQFIFIPTAITWSALSVFACFSVKEPQATLRHAVLRTVVLRIELCLHIRLNMPREAEPSNNERTFILQALQEDIRLDGRALNAHRQLDISFGDGHGAADVRLGKTRYHTITHILNCQC